MKVTYVSADEIKVGDVVQMPHHDEYYEVDNVEEFNPPVGGSPAYLKFSLRAVKRIELFHDATRLVMRVEP